MASASTEQVSVPCIAVAFAVGSIHPNSHVEPGVLSSGSLQWWWRRDCNRWCCCNLERWWRCAGRDWLRHLFWMRFSIVFLKHRVRRCARSRSVTAAAREIPSDLKFEHPYFNSVDSQFLRELWPTKWTVFKKNMISMIYQVLGTPSLKNPLLTGGGKKTNYGRLCPPQNGHPDPWITCWIRLTTNPP